MIEYLCEYYPHIAEKILLKMSWQEIHNIRQMSWAVDFFVEKINNCFFMNHLSVFWDKDYNVVAKPTFDCNRNMTESFEASLYNNRLKHVFTQKLSLGKFVGKNKKVCMKGLISCESLYIHGTSQQMALEFITSYRPGEVLLDHLTECSSDVLQNSALKEVMKLTVGFIEGEQINLRKRGPNLKEFTHFPLVCYEQQILEFIEDFIVGTQTIQRLTLVFLIPHLEQKLISKFKDNVKKESEGILRIQTSSEEAFVCVSESFFFFRSKKKSEKEKLQIFFDMGIQDFASNYDEAMLNEELDESINSGSDCADLSMLSAEVANISF